MAIPLTISSMPDKVAAKDLSNFLYLFTTTYNAGTYGPEFEPIDLLSDDHLFLDTIRAFHNALGRLEFLFFENNSPNDVQLEFLSFSYASPFKSVITGSIKAITLAVIVAGGSIEINTSGEIKAELRSLGHGIERLRNALRPDLYEEQPNLKLEVKTKNDGVLIKYEEDYD